MVSFQCLAATMFLFFACLAPAVGFGGLFALATNNAIGTVEMVSSTAACGVLYALFSSQPMTIIGRPNIAWCIWIIYSCEAKICNLLLLFDRLHWSRPCLCCYPCTACESNELAISTSLRLDRSLDISHFVYLFCHIRVKLGEIPDAFH